MDDNYLEARSLLRQEMVRRRHRPGTIGTYLSHLKQLHEFFPDKGIRDLRRQDFIEFFDYLSERKNLSRATIHQALMALRFLYSKVFQNQTELNSITLPGRKRKMPPILEPEEINRLLSAVQNIKHRTLLTLLYSSGLKASEAVRLRVRDIDLERRIVCISRQGRSIERKTVLSEESVKQIRLYYDAYAPDDWLFPGMETKSHLGPRMVEHVFDKALKRAGITKDVSVQDLRHAFAVHLLGNGADLGAVQQALGLKSYASVLFYRSLIEGRVPNITSPIDTFLPGQEKVVSRIQDIETLLLRVRNEDERDYLKESLLCFRVGALRAGVVFSWTAAVLNLRAKCFTERLELNEFLQRTNPKAHVVKNLDNLAYFKDKTILLAAEELQIVTKAEKEILDQDLDLRNKCGHPSRYYPKPSRVTAFLEELIDIVFTR